MGNYLHKEFECENGSIKTLFVRHDLVLDRMKIHIDTIIIKTAQSKFFFTQDDIRTF